MAAPAFLPKQRIIYFQGAKIRKICEPHKFIMVHKFKKNGANPYFLHFLVS